MGSQTRHQEATYQYKTVAVARSIFCGYGPHLDVSIPDNLEELKNVSIHAVLQFDNTVSAGNRKLYFIGGDYEMNTYPDQTVKAVQPAMMEVNLSADANRRIDVTVDITHLIKNLEFDLIGSFDQPSVALGMVTDKTGLNSVTGVLELWKVDLIYTTKGIQ